MPVTAYPHIVGDDPAKAGVEGTRYKVAHLAAEHYQHGWSAEELLRQHPDLRPEQVYAALAYFYDHRDAILSVLKATADTAKAAVGEFGLSRAELLLRKN